MSILRWNKNIILGLFMVSANDLHYSEYYEKKKKERNSIFFTCSAVFTESYTWSASFTQTHLIGQFYTLVGLFTQVVTLVGLFLQGGDISSLMSSRSARLWHIWDEATHRSWRQCDVGPWQSAAVRVWLSFCVSRHRCQRLPPEKK